LNSRGAQVVGQLELMKNLKVDIIVWFIGFHGCSHEFFLWTC